MTVYAKQINPAIQESPLFLFGEMPEGIIMDGNRHFHSHITPEYSLIREYFNEMKNEWENAVFWYEWNGASYTRTPRKPEISLQDLLSSYGFHRLDEKPWTTKQRHKWRLLLEDDEHDTDDEEIILPALALLTGHEWKNKTIRGTCQGDWQEIIYDCTLWEEKGLESFEAEYFNIGTEWMIHDETDPPEIPEEINGYTVYCTSWNDDGIRQEISDITGETPENIVMYEWTGEKHFDEYKKIDFSIYQGVK